MSSVKFMWGWENYARGASIVFPAHGIMNESIILRPVNIMQP
jgi:hypothetical protein